MSSTLMHSCGTSPETLNCHTTQNGYSTTPELVIDWQCPPSSSLKLGTLTVKDAGNLRHGHKSKPLYEPMGSW